MAFVLAHGTAERHEHVVQFYAADAELITVAGPALIDVFENDGFAVVIATEDHRRAFEAHLREHGADVDAARADGRLVTLDAADTLARLMRDGRIDSEAFSVAVGAVVRSAAATGRPVWAFGEMVGLLWAAGNVMAAVELEEAWDELAAEIGCTVHCAYPSEAVAGPQHASALEQVCRLHTSVLPGPPADTTWHFDPEAAAAAEARRAVVDVLRRHGHGEQLLEDARIVIAELAANAVRHAGTPFTVTVLASAAGVRIEVRDASGTLPAVPEDDPLRGSGRGLRLIAALTRGWGVEPTSHGKVVWAELAA